MHSQSEKPKKLKSILKRYTTQQQQQQQQQQPVPATTNIGNTRNTTNTSNANDTNLAHNEDRLRQIALRHAAIIQERQDLDLLVHRILIELSEFPPTRGPALTAARPAPEDALAFKAKVRIFPPADYDDLVVERNANGLCGYALCPRPPRKFARSSVFKLINSPVDGFDIVRTADLEKWCSRDCQRRTFWIKVQLNETLLAQRVGTPDFQIDLLDEDGATRTAGEEAAKQLSSLNIHEKKAEDARSQVLAVERGEDATDDTARDGLVNVVIREREVSATASPAPLDQPVQPDREDHLMMEGYKTRLGGEPSGGHSSTGILSHIEGHT